MRFAFLLAVSTVIGCTPTMVVKPEPALAREGSYALVDKRTAEQKKHRRDSTFSAISFYGESQIKPPALQLLIAKLVDLSNGAMLKIEVSEFRIIDYFPERAGLTKEATGTRPGWGTLMIKQSLFAKNTDWSFVEAAGITTYDDSVICLFVGTINDKAVKVVAHEPYDMAKYGFLVVDDPSFQAAVRTAIERTASQLMEQLTSSAPS